MATRCISRAASISPAILHRLRGVDVLGNSQISATRGFAKLPEHKIWEQESAFLRGGFTLHPLFGKPMMDFGIDFEHYLVQVRLPNREMSRDEIIDFYVKVLAAAVDNEDQARMKIYSVATKLYFAFGALMDEKLASKLRGSPHVLAVDPDWVLAVDPDCDLDAANKNYGGEPFIDGKPVPYDPKYHASHWQMQEGMYKPPHGVQTDAEIQGTGSEILETDAADNKRSTRSWLSRARVFWNGPSL